MRRFAHWTPRYIRDRLAEAWYHRTCPDQPWLTRAANQILADYLRDGDIGLEFGSGRSTLWFARRTKHLTSVEHNENWHASVAAMLKDAQLPNVDLHLVPQDKAPDDALDAAYVRMTERFATGSLDFVLVDGVYRDCCALKALRVIRPGGLLIIDNANWFLPCGSRSPDSRSAQQGPHGAIWEEVLQSIRQWRTIWTSSGVTDTALFFKPFEATAPRALPSAALDLRQSPEVEADRKAGTA